MPKKRRASYSVAFITLGILLSAHVHAWVDDYVISISSAADVVSKREQLIKFVWGADGFPTGASELVSKNIPSPVAGLENLERVEKLRTSMPTSTIGPVIVTSYHFIPARKKKRLVVVHQGHGCPISFDDAAKGSGGFQHTIKALLQDGYGVMAVFMPLQSEEQCEKGEHGTLFEEAPAGSRGTRFFLEPTAKSLNYIAKHYASYRDFDMIGFSGGGWTATVYAALDPRIKISIPVAGSLPLYLRKTPYSNDEEQTHAAFYEIAGYPDLYIMGSFGPGRGQVQVLNLHDPCCFSATFHDPALPHVADKPVAQQDFESSVRLYETRVQTVMKTLAAGSFRVVVDDGSKHTISDRVIDTVIRPALHSR
jgi:pimeloyl-ACP methyl ester carboxylesterase